MAKTDKNPTATTPSLADEPQTALTRRLANNDVFFAIEIASRNGGSRSTFDNLSWRGS
jgi:hypothetical protein